MARYGEGQESVLWSKHFDGDIAALLHRDRLTLICGLRDDAERVLADLGRVLGVQPESVAGLVLTPPVPTSPALLAEQLEGRPLLFDMETLCWTPWMDLAPVRFLRSLARESGIVAVWPGKVEGQTLTFSTPGRRDHVRENARGITLLKSRSTSFPDQVPFTVERL